MVLPSEFPVPPEEAAWVHAVGDTMLVLAAHGTQYPISPGQYRRTNAVGCHPRVAPGGAEYKKLVTARGSPREAPQHSGMEPGVSTTVGTGATR